VAQRTDPPVFGNAGTYLNGAVRTTTQVPIPASTAEFDVVLVHMYLEITNAVTPATDFAEVPGAEFTSNNTGGRVFWKRLTAAEGGTTYDFTHPSGFTEAVAERYTGCVRYGDPYDAGADSVQRSSADTNTPAVTITTANDNRLIVWSATSVSIGAWTPPTGYDERVDTGREITVATDELLTAGSSGSLVGTGPSDNMTAWALALIPQVATPVAPMIPQQRRALLVR